MVEFALILFPLLMVVAGIIYFGIGLNYWLDMNRVANQGARQAAVNNWPSQCPRSDCARILVLHQHHRRRHARPSWETTRERGYRTCFDVR